MEKVFAKKLGFCRIKRTKFLILDKVELRGWAEKYSVLLQAPRKPNPPAPLPYEGMGVISLSPSRREVWREVPR